jgi:NADH-quinone oxidoreductase subunit F
MMREKLWLKKAQKMNKMQVILNSDFIITFGTFIEDESLNDAILEAINKNDAKFVYMHPIDNTNLKLFYSQLIKYEVGSEEGICALLLNCFTSNCDEKTKNFLDDLDLGYISAESSAGEEEFEEAFENSKEAKVKTLIIGNDLVNHDRVENIVKLLAILKKYSDFNLVVLNEELAQKIDSCTDFDLEELEELKSFNGTLVYKLIDEKNDELITSQTFANIAKVSNGNEVFIISKNEKIKRVLKIDDDLQGTIAILKTKNNEDIFSGYRYKQVKIEKVEA